MTIVLNLLLTQYLQALSFVQQQEDPCHFDLALDNPPCEQHSGFSRPGDSMSQLISDFIIQPVVRQARRFSGRDSTLPSIPTASSHTPVEFPEYVDPLSTEYASQRHRGEENNGPERGTVDLRRAVAGREQRENETEISTVAARHRAETDPSARRRHQRRHLVPRERFLSASAAVPTTVNEAGSRFMEDSTMLATSDAAAGDRSGDVPVIEPRLPEDDGMRNMRKRIQNIQSADISADQKSRMVHDIMVEQYMMNGNGMGLRTQSPSSLQRHERPFTPISRDSMDIVKIESPGTSASLAVEDMVIAAEDMKPTYWIPPVPVDAATPQQSRKSSAEIERHFGCEHYKRNVKLQCSACMKWYTCRFCHDRVEDHCLNRQATKNMLCMNCGTAQLASDECKHCGFCAAYYFCKLCKLWDDDSTRPIYHCDSCGICRRGEGLGRDFFHCQV